MNACIKFSKTCVASYIFTEDFFFWYTFLFVYLQLTFWHFLTQVISYALILHPIRQRSAFFNFVNSKVSYAPQFPLKTFQHKKYLVRYTPFKSGYTFYSRQLSTCKSPCNGVFNTKMIRSPWFTPLQSKMRDEIDTSIKVIPRVIASSIKNNHLFHFRYLRYWSFFLSILRFILGNQSEDG